MTFALNCIRCKDIFELPQQIVDYSHPKIVQCPNCGGYVEVVVQIHFIQHRVRVRKGALP